MSTVTRTSTSTEPPPAGGSAAVGGASAAGGAAAAGGASRSRVDLACAVRGDATRAVALAGAGLLRARLLSPDSAVLRIALVQTAAALLGGDRVTIDVRLGAGARAEIREIAGLVAHDVRGGDGAEIVVRMQLAAGARLHWAAQPLVLACGCELRRSTRIELADGAAVLLRDTLVLGRAGEEPGRLRSSLAVRHAGRDLHVETLDTGDRALLRSSVVLGDAKVLDTLGLYGKRADDPAALQLAGPGTIRPLPVPSLAASERMLAPLTTAWREDLYR